MAFEVFDWKNNKGGGTRLNATNLDSLETRIKEAIEAVEASLGEAGLTEVEVKELIGDEAQPLDSDLTAIAALTTTATGRSLLAIANAAAGRTILSWYVVMQQKQTQPYVASDPPSSPIIQINVRNGKWMLILEPAEGEYTWSEAPVTKERWTRFCVDAHYATSAADGGFIRVQVDDRAEPTGGLFVPQYDSEVMERPTLASAVGDQENGSPPIHYEDGEAIPGHLRLGQYRNTVHDVDTVTRVSNVQVYEVTGSGELVEVG